QHTLAVRICQGFGDLQPNSGDTAIEVEVGLGRKIRIAVENRGPAAVAAWLGAGGCCGNDSRRIGRRVVTIDSRAAGLPVNPELAGKQASSQVRHRAGRGRTVECTSGLVLSILGP